MLFLAEHGKRVHVFAVEGFVGGHGLADDRHDRREKIKTGDHAFIIVSANGGVFKQARSQVMNGSRKPPS